MYTVSFHAERERGRPCRLIFYHLYYSIDDRLGGSMDYHHGHHIQPPPQADFTHPSGK